MWRVSDDFSGTRISYGCKLWLIVWTLLTDWTFLAGSELERSKPSSQSEQIGRFWQEWDLKGPK